VGDVTGGAIADFLQEKLDQPQGWSLRSLSEDFADKFELSESEALDAIRTQVTKTLNKGRELGYRQQGDLDERRFKWLGPDDEDVTDTCQRIKERTNPDFGGEPKPLDELLDIVEEESRKDFPDFTTDGTAAHYEERHTFVEHFN